MSLKLVPFNATWITHDKIDVHAIYRRPRFKEDAYGELNRDTGTNGVPTWDLTGPLPVRSHTRWTSKGFEYVTLASRQSLIEAGRKGTIEGDWRAYDQHQTGGPWNWKKYAEGQAATTTLEAEELKQDIADYGWKAVEAIRRRSDPTFSLPNHLKVEPEVPEQPVTEAADGKKRKADDKKGSEAA